MVVHLFDDSSVALFEPLMMIVLLLFLQKQKLNYFQPVAELSLYVICDLLVLFALCIESTLSDLEPD